MYRTKYLDYTDTNQATNFKELASLYGKVVNEAQEAYLLMAQLEKHVNTISGLLDKVTDLEPVNGDIENIDLATKSEYNNLIRQIKTERQEFESDFHMYAQIQSQVSDIAKDLS